MEPLRRDAEDLVRRFGGGAGDSCEVLGAYFDLCVRHGTLMRALLNDLGSLNEVGLVDLIMDWRRRLDAALVGESPGTPARMGAVVALGASRTSPSCSRRRRRPPTVRPRWRSPRPLSAPGRPRMD
ncbi:hypothetical protein ABZ635_03835 [Nocardiopsis sp. NPDC007018]|uniref:hypothetical protein n=1 Tax=Nocardiopsis sp. NPDC007018 TaxID=3155721 RepID=UPI0033F2F6B4